MYGYRKRSKALADHNMMRTINPIKLPAVFLQQLNKVLSRHSINIQHICCICKPILFTVSAKYKLQISPVYL